MKQSTDKKNSATLKKKSAKQQKNKPKTGSAPLSVLATPQQTNRILKKQQPEKKGLKQYMGVNQVLEYNFADQKPIFYVPCYLRMKVQRVDQINYIQSRAQIETEMRLWLMIKQFPDVVVDQIINQAKLQINGSKVIQFEHIIQPLKLDQTQIKNKSPNAMGFMYSDEMQLTITSDPFWSPYQLVYLISNVQIKKITLGQGNPQFEKKLKKVPNGNKYLGATVQFNFMDANPFLQFSFGQVRSLGSFDIAQSLLDMKFSNDSIKDDDVQMDQQQQEQKLPFKFITEIIGYKQNLKLQKLKAGEVTPDAFQHGQIVIPLYKYPSTTLINVFVPLYVVGVTCLGVFFQDNDMSNRDGGLSNFLLAFIAFLPTIRQNLPATPKVVFTEILAYTQIACAVICFLYSLSINKQQQYGFEWNTNPIFLLCLSLTILNMAIVFGMFIHHKAFKERKYNKLPKGAIKYINALYMNTDLNDQWANQKCQQQFKPAIELQIVKPYVKKMIKIEQNDEEQAPQNESRNESRLSEVLMQ